MNRIIEEYAKLNNIIFGVCDAHDLEGMGEEILNIPFFNGDFRDRVSPQASLTGAKSIIVLGVEVNKKSIFEGLDCVVAASMSGMDYHKRLRTIAQNLVDLMLKQAEFNYKIQIDSGPLAERALAVKAGLGFSGKNQCVISHKFGSFFNIALIIVDIGLDYTMQMGKLTCEKCDTCMISCPASALGHNGNFDYTKCISYLTQKKGALTDYEAALIGTSIYGCDICQNVCPHNARHAVRSPKEVTAKTLNRILKMDNTQFEECFKDSHFFWRGQATINRNCLIAIDNLDLCSSKNNEKYGKG